MSRKKLWQGRFTQKTSEIFEQFNNSLAFDFRLYQEDILGSLAHVEMLAKQKIITAAEGKKIENGLKKILTTINHNPSAWFEGHKDYEDIHSAIEQELFLLIGETAKKLHTARSRNDQVATDLRLWLKNQRQTLIIALEKLVKCLINLARRDINVFLPGYTHLQQAQPISLAHYWLALVEKFSRDLEKLEDLAKRNDLCPLGSGALAGTTYPIDRLQVAKKLGFSGITANSLDAVSDRDFVLEYEFILCNIMLHLSQFAEEMIIWNSSEFKFIDILDSFATGSSMMPQKKNPDIPELLRGKCGRVIGVLNALMITLKGLPQGYNKDLQEDKELLFMANDTTVSCLEITVEFLKHIRINEINMQKQLSNSYLAATDVADYLVRQGLAFRDAYQVTGSLVSYCLENDKKFSELSLEEFKKFHKNFEHNIYDAIKIESMIDARDIPGGTSRKQIKKVINKLQAKYNE